jgi:DNA-binding transcriptional MocR family regulator
MTRVPAGRDRDDTGDEEVIEVTRQQSTLWSATPRALARDGTLSDKAFRLWIVLASYADRSTGECFPKVRALTDHCGCHRSTIWRAQAELIDRGLLEVETRRAQRRPNLYTIIDPVDHVAPTRRAPRRAHATPAVAPTRHAMSRPRDNNEQESIEQESPTKDLAADAAAKATDDPLVACARNLAQLAFEQPVTPVTRGGFATVMKRIQAELEAHTPPAAIARAIESGDAITWTADALRTAIARATPKSRKRAGHRDGDPRSTDDILRGIRAGEERRANGRLR